MKEKIFFTKEEQKILDSGEDYLEPNYFGKDVYDYTIGNSYIIKVPIKNNNGDIARFIIAERNETWIDSEIGSPESVSWWEIPGELVRKFLLEEFFILKKISLSNRNHQDQKVLNLEKKVWCQKEGIPIEENKQCEVILSDFIKNKIKVINSSYKDIKNYYQKLENKNEIPQLMYKLVTTEKYKLEEWCKLKRWQIRKGKQKGDIIFNSEDEYVVFLVLKDCILNFSQELDKKTWGLYDKYELFWNYHEKTRDFVKKMIALTCYKFIRICGPYYEITYDNKPLKDIRSLAYCFDQKNRQSEKKLPTWLWTKLEYSKKILSEYERKYNEKIEEPKIVCVIDNKHHYSMDKSGNLCLIEKNNN